MVAVGLVVYMLSTLVLTHWAYRKGRADTAALFEPSRCSRCGEPL